MKRTISGLLIISVVAMVATLVSCDLLFSNVNIFSGLDGPNIDELSKAEGSSLVSQLQDNKGGENGAFGETFVTRLEENPTELAAILANLSDFYTTATDPNDVAEAAALYAEITLLTTDTGDAVNGIVGAALAASEELETGADLTMDSVISSLFGSDSAVASSAEAFIAFAADMKSVATAYTAVGEALDGGADIELGLDTGQAAVVSLVFGALMDSVQPTLDLTDDEKAALIYELLINPADPSVPFNPDDLFGADGDMFLADNMTIMTEDPFNTALFDASGITDLLDLMGLSAEEPAV